MARLLFIFLFISFIANAQTQVVETVESKDITDVNRNGKSYEYTNQIRLVAPFTFKATAQSAFSCKPFNVQNQPPTLSKNFVRTEGILVSGILTENAISTLPVQSKTTEYSYINGLDRPMQSVVVQGSPFLKDVIKFQQYDDYGRQPKEFLPYATTNAKGGFRSNAETEQGAFFKTTPLVSWDDEPYKINKFDDSPLNQVRRSYGSGKEWHSNDKYSEVKILVNTASDAVRLFTYLGPSTVYPYYNLPIPNGFYPANSLTVEESKDEEGQIKRVYKNFKGQTILSRIINGAELLDTNYIYDWEGNVFCVIPPEASFKLNTAANYETATDAVRNQFLEDNCFRYEYDDLQRVVAKKVPGAGWFYMVYDKWDRLVMTWDGSTVGQTLRWQFTKYDEYNRPIITGFYYSSQNSTRQTVQSDINNYYSSNPIRFEIRQSNATGYTQNRTFPLNPSESNLQSVTYYDDYAFLGYSGWDAEAIQSFPGGTIVQLRHNYVQENNLPPSTALLPTYRGYTTGSKVRVVGDTKWLNSVTYYDNKYRVIQTITENHLNGTDRLSSDIDFAGRNKQTLITHTTSTGTFTLLEKYDYDHAGRILKTWQTLDGAQPVLVSAQTYNEAGEVIEKNIHSTDNGVNFLQSVDYRYNIRGWLTSVNNSSLTNDGVLNNDGNDIMGMEILYNTSVQLNSTDTRKMWNGNIGAIKWKTTNLIDPAKEKIFGFNYDQVNRLRKADYATKLATAFTGDFTAYESSYEYDKNGNIQFLKRNGLVGGAIQLIDNLKYDYGNKTNILRFVTDNALSYSQFGVKGYGFVEKTKLEGDEYVYDSRGNATQDLNKGIDVTYNHLNMPTRVDFGGGNYIQYTYDALGNKLKDQVFKNGSVATTRDYIGGVHYENNTLAFLANGEGRAIKTGTQWQYEYFLRDHQGNTLATFGNLKDANVFKAGMELEKASTEEADFRNIYNRRSQDYNATSANAEIPMPNRSILTNGVTSSIPMGPAKSKLIVNPGDRVKMSVLARSVTPTTGANADVIAGTLVGIVTSGLGVIPGEAAYTAFSNNIDILAGNITANSNSPKAYLNYVLFKSNYTGTPQFGYVPLPATAASKFDLLEIEITIPAGYANGEMYIYTNNESNYNVYFDEMFVLHEKASNALQVTQLSDYYPFGLGFNVWNKESIKANRYLYQKQELQDDLGYDEYQYKYRMHDPAMGRFLSVDPLAEKYMYNSTYAFSENRVIDGIELEGKEFQFSEAMYSLSSLYGSYVDQYRNDFDGGYTWGALQMTGDWLASPFKSFGNAWKTSLTGTQQMIGNRAERSDASYSENVPMETRQMIEPVQDLSAATKMTAGPTATVAAADIAIGLTLGGIQSSLVSNLRIGLGSEFMGIKYNPGEMSSLSGLKPTHYITKSEKSMKRFVNEISADGTINNPIKYAEYNGSRYIVDGHHRYFAAQKLGFQNVPVERVSLPFKGYRTNYDLLTNLGRQPTWWRYYMPKL